MTLYSTYIGISLLACTQNLGQASSGGFHLHLLGVHFVCILSTSYTLVIIVLVEFTFRNPAELILQYLVIKPAVYNQERFTIQSGL